MSYTVTIAKTIWCEKEVEASSEQEAEEMVWNALDRGIDAIGEPPIPTSRFPGFDFRWGEGEIIETFRYYEEE